jgi:uncharacterized membrane protein
MLLTKIKTSFGEKMSDRVASAVGSWKFIIIQSTIIAIWIAFNINIPSTGFKLGNLVISPWDPYPFIFLNLALSFQAAYTAPIIMMSQNRQSQIDRQHAEEDYRVNREAKADVEHIKQELRRAHNKLLQHQNIQVDVSSLATDMKQITKDLEDLKNLLQTQSK